jgi:3-hydroxyacyl-[acyl-carrier protein] dehydratase/trans-2-decenoyl-[acyl-carrier protein] isomerase
MVDKRESYTKEDLLASGRGELFGEKAHNYQRQAC